MMRVSAVVALAWFSSSEALGSARERVESDETLMGFQKFTDNLVGKYTQDQTPPDDDTVEAIGTIIAYFEEMYTTVLLPAHHADELRAKNCHTKIERCLNDHFDDATLELIGSLKNTTERERQEHLQCRGDHTEVCQGSNDTCSEYDTYRYTNDLALLPGCVDPQPDGDLADSDISTMDESTLAKMEVCLTKTRNWFNPLYALYLSCHRGRDNCTDYAKQCKQDQYDFEVSHCEWSTLRMHHCGAHRVCWDEAISHCDEDCDEIADNVELRQVENETMERIECLLKVLMSPNESKSTDLADCQDRIFNHTPWDINCTGSDGEQEPVLPISCDTTSVPCSDVFLTEEYTGITVDLCKTCDEFVPDLEEECSYIKFSNLVTEARTPTCQLHDGTIWALCGEDPYKRWGIGLEGQAQALVNCQYSYNQGGNKNKRCQPDITEVKLFKSSDCTGPIAMPAHAGWKAEDSAWCSHGDAWHMECEKAVDGIDTTHWTFHCHKESCEPGEMFLTVKLCSDEQPMCVGLMGHPGEYKVEVSTSGAPFDVQLGALDNSYFKFTAPECYDTTKFEQCMQWAPWSKEKNGCKAYALGMHAGIYDCHGCGTLTRAYKPCDMSECVAACTELYGTSLERDNCVKGCRQYKTILDPPACYHSDNVETQIAATKSSRIMRGVEIYSKGMSPGNYSCFKCGDLARDYTPCDLVECRDACDDLYAEATSRTPCLQGCQSYKNVADPEICFSQAAYNKCSKKMPNSKGRNGCAGYSQGMLDGTHSCHSCLPLARTYVACDPLECSTMCENLYGKGNDKDRCRKGCREYTTAKNPPECYNSAKLDACTAWATRTSMKNGCEAMAQGMIVGNYNCFHCKPLTKAYAACDIDDCKSMCDELYKGGGPTGRATTNCKLGCAKYKKLADGDEGDDV